MVVASRKADACAETEAHLTAMGGEALGVATHMGELDALQALVDATVERFGGIDIVINNAANALTQPLGEFTTDAWTKSYDVNLRGPVFLVQYALPYLKASEHAAHRGEVRLGLGAGVGLAAGDDHLGAGADQALGQRAADAARSTGDDRHPAGQVEELREFLAVHSCLLTGVSIRVRGRRGTPRPRPRAHRSGCT